MTFFPMVFSHMKPVIFLILIENFYTTVHMSILSAIFDTFEFNLNIYLESTRFSNTTKKNQQ